MQASIEVGGIFAELPLFYNFIRICGEMENFLKDFKGTVQPDWIYMKAVPLDRP
jgi:hypothetical protein